ncbi:protein LATERAL ROOT PRIMORDIUM 1-like [Phragmites australis]|uniref:protein LATERAL ROOT PRIMORDIUM 1-like n=1 Tax=Phragmites australis TaxID=29695 RepID=UPI002D78BD38|nr:protein LATERAL ROOT PRIMORDIUM 1-like [Phragmites australis]XP_062208115.1 protein LATERAL ROOT PRIMORDIUM 1-like [Phragmites australis]
MRQAAALNYGMTDVGMVVVAPAASFHHTHHHHHHHEATAAAAAADPIFPLLSAGPCVLDPDTVKSGSGAPVSSAIQFWQSQPPPQQPSSAAGANPNPSVSPFAYLKKPLPMLDTGGGSSGSGAATCQDCGNQAKKDCSHNRCRTCCKSRGFDCSTHVKSTWVPAARRRERQQLAGSGSASSSPATASAAAVASASGSKKARLLSSQTTTSHTSTSNATTPRSFDTTSSHQDASFKDNLPRQVRAPAVFKCVRVTSIDDGEDEYAYQAMVTINGHVFKGFLYDHGVDDGRHASTNNDDSTAGVPNFSELHLGGPSASGPGASAAREGSSSMVPMELYGGGGGQHILGGSTYGNTMN